MPLQFSDSEESDLEEEEIIDCSKIDKPTHIQSFLEHIGVCVSPNDS